MKIAPSFYLNNAQIKNANNLNKISLNYIKNESLSDLHFGASYINPATYTDLTPSELNEVQKFEKTIPSITEKYDSKLESALNNADDLKTAHKAKIDEVLKLYEKKSQSSSNSRKIEIKNGTMFEYASDGKTILRETLFDDEAYEVEFKKSFFGKVSIKRTKTPKFIYTKEFNEDGSSDLITKNSYIKGYKKYPNGSEEYKEALMLKAPFVNDKMRFYTKDFKKDENGNESFSISVYREMDSCVPIVYRENERRTKEYIKADVQYRTKAPMFGSLTKTYFENYFEENGKSSCLKFAKISPDGFVEYKENDDETSKHFKRDNNSSLWQKVLYNKN